MDSAFLRVGQQDYAGVKTLAPFGKSYSEACEQWGTPEKPRKNAAVDTDLSYAIHLRAKEAIRGYYPDLRPQKDSNLLHAPLVKVGAVGFTSAYTPNKTKQINIQINKPETPDLYLVAGTSPAHNELEESQAWIVGGISHRELMVVSKHNPNFPNVRTLCIEQLRTLAEIEETYHLPPKLGGPFYLLKDMLEAEPDLSEPDFSEPEVQPSLEDFIEESEGIEATAPRRFPAMGDGMRIPDIRARLLREGFAEDEIPSTTTIRNRADNNIVGWVVPDPELKTVYYSCSDVREIAEKNRLRGKALPAGFTDKDLLTEDKAAEAVYLSAKRFRELYIEERLLTVYYRKGKPMVLAPKLQEAMIGLQQYITERPKKEYKKTKETP